MKKLYVVADGYSSYIDDPDARIWTLSEDRFKCGWETDGGYPGYGLTKARAQEIAEAYNARIGQPDELTEEGLEKAIEEIRKEASSVPIVFQPSAIVLSRQAAEYLASRGYDTQEKVTALFDQINKRTKHAR